MKMQDKKTRVLEYMREIHSGGRQYISPTSVGMDVFRKPYYTASSIASPVLKSLVNDGLVERNTRGHYRIATEQTQ